mgnify:FL=1
MKKIKLLTFILLLCMPSYLSAAWTCSIKDKSAQVLLDYVKDNKQVIKNISNAITENNNKKKELDTSNSVSNQISKAVNETVSLFNQSFNFKWYFSYAEYFLTFPLISEIPVQVKRDYWILDKQNKFLLEYVKMLDSQLYTQIVVSEACKWVTSKCNLNNKTAKEIVSSLIYNNDQILNLFRLSILWYPDEFDWVDLILVNNSFELEIKKAYSTESIKACSKEKWWFFEQISTAIKDIELLNKQWRDWIDMWKDSWELLIWNDPNNDEAKIEKRELSEELSRKWISTENKEILKSNLEKYNTEWINLNSNFVSNTIISTYWKIEEQLKFWNEEVVWDFFDEKVEKININDLNRVTDNSELSKEIQEKITTLYEKEVPFAAIWDVVTEWLRSKIIKTHFSLDDSINTLEKTIKVSQKVCNSQSTWDWLCK